MYLKDKPQYFTFTEKFSPNPFIVSWRRTFFVFFVHNIDFLQTQKRSLTKSCKTENVKWRTVVWRASQDWWSNCHWFFKYWPAMGWDGTQLDSGLWLIRLEFHRTTSIGAFGHLHVFVFVVAFAFVSMNIRWMLMAIRSFDRPQRNKCGARRPIETNWGKPEGSQQWFHFSSNSALLSSPWRSSAFFWQCWRIPRFTYLQNDWSDLWPEWPEGI